MTLNKEIFKYKKIKKIKIKIQTSRLHLRSIESLNGGKGLKIYIEASQDSFKANSGLSLWGTTSPHTSLDNFLF